MVEEGFCFGNRALDKQGRAWCLNKGVGRTNGTLGREAKEQLRSRGNLGKQNGVASASPLGLPRAPTS